MGGAITNASGGSIEASTSDGIFVSDGSSVGGGIHNETGARIDARYNGVYVKDGATQISNGIRNDGTIDADQHGISVLDANLGGGIVNDANGAIVAAEDGLDLYGGSVTGGIRSAGSIQAGGRAIDVFSNVTLDGGVSNTGDLQGALRIDGQTSSGGGIDLTNAGRIDVGNSGGSSLSGNFIQTAAGVFALTLGTFSDFTDPVLAITGDALLAGELLIKFDAGFAFEPAGRLTLFDIAGTRTGWFSNYANDAQVASLGGGNALFIDYNDDGVDLYAGSVPLPGSPALLELGLLGLWSAYGRSRRRRCASIPGTRQPIGL